MSARDVQLTHGLFSPLDAVTPHPPLVIRIATSSDSSNHTALVQITLRAKHNPTQSEELSIAVTPESLFKLGVKTGVPVGTFGPGVIDTGDINPNISSLGTVQRAVCPTDMKIKYSVSIQGP